MIKMKINSSLYTRKFAQSQPIKLIRFKAKLIKLAYEFRTRLEDWVIY